MKDKATDGNRPEGMEEQLRAILDATENGPFSNESAIGGMPDKAGDSTRFPAGMAVTTQELVRQAATQQLQQRKERIEDIVAESTEVEALKLEIAVRAIDRMKQVLINSGTHVDDDVADNVILELFARGVQRIPEVMEKALLEANDDRPED